MEVIHRGSLAVEHLSLDTAHACIYWTTTHSVEVSRLTGENHQVIQKLVYFSGEYVLGAAVDEDSHSLFWMVKSAESTTLYRMDILDSGRNHIGPLEKVTTFETTTM